MPRACNDNGRAYEFAWLVTLEEKLGESHEILIEQNTSYFANKRSWEMMSERMQGVFLQSATQAADCIIDNEPYMTTDESVPIHMKFQSDDAGVNGDVRDLVIFRPELDWEIGLSIKHNHDAIKHSRLSRTLDFANSWVGIPCSAEYWNNVNPIFERLVQLKNAGVKWREMEDKEDTVYIPLLEAFLAEIDCLYTNYEDIPKRLVEYLIGNKDYYKVECYDTRSHTIIETFNLHDSLSRCGLFMQRLFDVPMLEYPTQIIRMGFKKNSNNTVIIEMDKDWAISFRIHNASTNVEASLKFDVQFVSRPDSISHRVFRW